MEYFNKNKKVKLTEINPIETAVPEVHLCHA